MFDVRQTPLPGVRELRPNVRSDPRGRFVKLFHRDEFARHGMAADFQEQYCTTSRRGVLRGLHFQLPPHDHDKLVTCLEGEVQDVVLDLRRNSASYGWHAVFMLSGADCNQVYVPSGCAHGFCVLSETATLLYDVGTVHAPSHDAGVRWDSAGITWPVRDPVVSDRDAGLPDLAGFSSPF